MWESKGRIGDHPIVKIKVRAEEDVRRKHFSKAQLVEDGGGAPAEEGECLRG